MRFCLATFLWPTHHLGWRLATLPLIWTCLFWSLSGQARSGDQPDPIRQMAQLAEYIGADYPTAVADGRVIDAGEYQEMTEFAQVLVQKAAQLSQLRTGVAAGTDKIQTVRSYAQSLQSAIADQQAVEGVQQVAAALRQVLLKLSPDSSVPARLLPDTETQALYQASCASCHGVTGRGDGTLATQLEPTPTDFTDHARALNRSVLGLHDAISEGIAGTAMAAFNPLTEQQRWSLAFYVGSLAFESANPLAPPARPTLSLQQLVNSSPALLAKQLPASQQSQIAHLRANPAPLFTDPGTPLTITRNRLRQAQAAYQQADYDRAHDLAVSAYLDGFELIENSLDARDQTLRKQIETTLIGLRQAITNPDDGAALARIMAVAFAQLDAADQLLNGASLSAGALFSASLVILLREGLEALLVIIALMTILIRIDRRDTLKYVHIGWGGALLAGIATWWVAQSLITISGASREVMEGVAAALAAAVLLYVGIWMHSKTHAAHWQAFIQARIDSTLGSGTLWGLTALAFITVYREVFETVLFYQSLLTQVATTQVTPVVGGFLVGAVMLVALAWVLVKYSIKLPIAQFFAVTTYLLLTLSFVLAGKSVSALQEAAMLAISPLPVAFSVQWLGVNSTWQGIAAQVSVLAAFAIFVVRGRMASTLSQG
ncbi:MAG: cytochrome c/FTR1 family iron permease [Immundisolibacteraceae bacterium]|nr:cytochrome c/FTR1 family iron permease [Immundisolibacteraceae bacterium]